MPTFAAVVVKKFKDAGFVKGKQEDFKDKSLCDVLKQVKNKAKKQLQKRRATTSDTTDSYQQPVKESVSLDLFNLKAFSGIISQIAVSDLLDDEKTPEKVRQLMEKLQELDITFLANVCMNGIVQMPLLDEERDACQEIIHIRNRICHLGYSTDTHDYNEDQLHKLCAVTEQLCSVSGHYLTKADFQTMRKECLEESYVKSADKIFSK